MSDEPKAVLVGGKPVTADHREIDPATGMQKEYVVLSDAERAKGFVRPYRDKYIHVGVGGTEAALTGTGCGVETRMHREISETYARDPKFYNGTFCVGCKKHLPLEEFIWSDTDERVGS
jgi:hypothetical protein